MDDLIIPLIGTTFIIIISWYELYGRKKIKFKNELKHIASDIARCTGADESVMYHFFVDEGAKLYCPSSKKGKYVLYNLFNNYGWYEGEKITSKSNINKIDYAQMRKKLHSYWFGNHFVSLDDTMSNEIKDVYIYVVLRMTDKNYYLYGLDRYQALRVLYYCLQRVKHGEAGVLIRHIMEHFDGERSPYTCEDCKMVSEMQGDEFIKYITFVSNHSESEIRQMEREETNGNT